MPIRLIRIIRCFNSQFITPQSLLLLPQLPKFELYIAIWLQECGSSWKMSKSLILVNGLKKTVKN